MKHKWYHRIQLPDGTWTREDDPYPSVQFILKQLDGFSFEGKRVLDIGCRDGQFSFLAAQRGAEIIAVDNYRSPGMMELLKVLDPNIFFRHQTVYDVRDKGADVVMLFGVLYHLRYPMLGLKACLDCLRMGGILLLETAIVYHYSFPLLYCPVNSSPYEPSSCSFFNSAGLTETLASLGGRIVHSKYLDKPQGDPPVDRGFFVIEKVAPSVPAEVWAQWHEVIP